MWHFRTLIGLALVSGSLWANEAMYNLPPRIAMPRFKQVKIDGQVTPQEKAQTIGMNGLCRLGKILKLMPILPAEATFHAGTDGRNLYIGIICETGPQGILQRVRPPRGGSRIWLDDTLEFVMVPDPAQKIPSIYHLMINNRGAFSSTGRQGANNIAWKPKFQAKGQVIGRHWHFEILLPLQEFGLKEFKNGQQFGLRICRNWKRTTPAFGGRQGCQSAWSQDKCAFFSTDALPLVTFDPAAPVVEFLSIQKNGQADLKVKIINPNPTAQNYKMVYLHQPQNSKSIAQTSPLTLKPGETKIIQLPVDQITPEEFVSTVWRLTSKDGKKIYYHRAFRWYLRQPEMFMQDNLAQQQVVFKYAYYPASDKIFLTLDFSTVQNPGIRKLTAVVRDAQKKEVCRAVLPQLRNQTVEYLWNIPDLKTYTAKNNPSGQYTLSVQAEGNIKYAITRNFERKIFHWENNKLGQSRKLLPRFTPIKVKNQTVSVVLRDYEMSKTGLFRQIKADGDVLLADSGMYFEAVVNGRKQKVQGDHLHFTSQAPDRATAIAQWHAGKLQAQGQCLWDYDGLMKYQLTLKPFAGKLDSLKLVIPLLERNAYLFHACTDGMRFNYGGAVFKGQGRIWDSTKAARRDLQSDYVNYIWLGTEGRGLAVCGENDRNWELKSGVPTQELIRRDGKLYLVYNLIAQPIVVKQPRTLEVAFQATPIKPMAPNWRRSALWATPRYALPYLDYQMVFIGSCRPRGGETSSNDLAPRDEDLSLYRLFKEIRQKGAFPEVYVDRYGKAHHLGSKNFAAKFFDLWGKGYVDKQNLPTYRREINFALYTMREAPANLVTFYTNARGMRTDVSEAFTFRDDWFREDFQGARERAPQRPSSLSYSVDPVESFRDYAMYWYEKMISSGACDNIYWDDVFLASNMDYSGKSAAYRMKNGVLQPSVGLWNIRELIRRTAVLQMELGRVPNNTVHMTNTALSPICAFAQQNLDWEDNMGTNVFQQRYTKEYIRAVGLGRQFGNLPGALGLVVAHGDPQVIAWCLRTGAGVSLTHEILWTKGAPAKDFWKNKVEMFKFGYGRPEVAVWNYWQKNYPVRISGDTSSLLLVKKSTQEAILLVCDYANGGDFTAQLDLDKMGLAGKISAVNFETGAKLAVNGNKISFKLKKHDFIHIRIKANK